MTETGEIQVCMCAYGHPAEIIDGMDGDDEKRVVCAKPEYGGCPNAEVPPLRVPNWNALQGLITDALQEAFTRGNDYAFKLLDDPEKSGQIVDGT